MFLMEVMRSIVTFVDSTKVGSDTQRQLVLYDVMKHKSSFTKAVGDVRRHEAQTQFHKGSWRCTTS